MVVRFRDRRLWLAVQMQKDVMVQARTEEVGTQHGCEVLGLKVVAGCTDAEGCECTGTYTGGKDADGCEVQG
jgi:hypothetical protein